MRNVRANLALLLLAAGPAAAADVTVVGLFPNKAVVVINGAKPRTMAVGETSPEGVRLIAASSEAAVFEIGGQRRTLAAGEGAAIAASAPPPRAGVVTLTADSRGHFITTGAVNGIPVRFMVDTGASLVALSRSEAKRLGVNYLAGTRSLTHTASGLLPVYRVKLDSVRVGDITVNNVDAVVLDGDALPVALLGMSFLNRMEMRREGVTLTLTRRY